MDNFVYCSECHTVFFDVAAKTCHICREGTLLDITYFMQSARPTQRAVDASPDTCEHGFMRGNCYVEICSFSKYGERN